jgi:hypothetical protein
VPVYAASPSATKKTLVRAAIRFVISFLSSSRTTVPEGHCEEKTCH